MFPTQSKVHRTSRLWLLPVVALAMLLVGYAVFAASTAQAQTPAGDVCVEGLVIDWQEKPLAGWTITLTRELSESVQITAVSAPAPEQDDDPEYKSKKSDKYPYEYPAPSAGTQKGEFEFSEDDIADAFGGLFTGLYTATIEIREGWEGVTPTTIDFPIEVGADGCAQIRFKMRRVVAVDVFKIDADHQPLGGWKITAVPGPGNLFASPQTIETSEVISANGILTGGLAAFTLTPGLWIISEAPPKGDKSAPQDSYVPVVPPTGRQELYIPSDIEVTDEPIRVVFKNELVTGCFIVRKLGLTNEEASVLGPSYNIGGWGFKLLRKDGTVARQGVTDASGLLYFDDLPLGPYTIVEEDRPGWNEVTPREYDIVVEGNACGDVSQAIEFRNEQDDSGFCIEGRKIDANGGYGLAGWEIKAKALDAGGYAPATAVTDGLGKFKITFPRNDYRIPGAKYEVCEQEQDGWLPHNPTCQTVRLPEWPSSCVKLEDFVNQQVGHTESQEHGKGGNPGKGGPSTDNVSCSSTHIVQAGEGLFDIGRQHNRSAQQMLDANPSVRDGKNLWVYVGQKICIP